LVRFVFQAEDGIRDFHVTGVQTCALPIYPLTSLADDAAAARRAIAIQDGSVVLVGHSWGGMVISEAGNDPKVAALVYIAALVPRSEARRVGKEGTSRRSLRRSITKVRMLR